MRLFARNPDLTGTEMTYLSSSTAQGATIFKAKNTDRFTDGQMILVGAMSRERSEILELATHTATQLTLAAADFPHDADDPVYVLDYDQVRIYRSTTGSGGVFSLLDTVPIDVDNVDGKTWYTDQNSLTTYWYQVAFYDSVGDNEGDRSPAIQATGYPELAVGTIITEVASEVKDKDFIEMDIPAYISTMNNINADLITQAKRPYRFLKTSESLTAEANASTIDLPDDLWKVNYIEVNEFGPASEEVFRPKQVPITKARWQLAWDTMAGDYVDGISVDDEAMQLVFFPKARVQRIGAFTIHYYKNFTRFTDFSNIVETPNTLIYKLGLKREFYLRRADDDSKYMVKFNEYDKAYQAEVMKMNRGKNIMADGPTGMGPDQKKYNQFGGVRYRQ